MLQLPNFDFKKFRAKVLLNYLDNYNLPRKVVCFTCGNAARALRETGFNVLEIGPNGAFQTNKWWGVEEIKTFFPNYFDATSGHLSIEAMAYLAKWLHYKDYALQKGQTYAVPSGSGETICILAMAYPLVDFVAVYDNSNPATLFNLQAPLNALVRAVAKDVIILE